MPERLTKQEFGLATFCDVCARALVKSNRLPAIEHGLRTYQVGDLLSGAIT